MHSLVLAMCCLLTGNIHAQSGAPLSNAHIALGGTATQKATTDASGDFAITASPGTYNLDASVQGFSPVTVSVTLDHDTRIDVALEPLDSAKLRMIGTVTVNGRLAPIQGAIPSITVTRSDFDRLGQDRVVDGLQAIPSVTFARPDGGSSAAIAVAALRGPDPSESLVALDGQLLNDGNTGDLDLGRLPVAAFSAVDVTEGLGPQDSNGSNTFGGAINFLSLHSTKTPHYALSLSGGSFGQREGWANATGTIGHLGYGFALDSQYEGGYVNQTVPVISPGGPGPVPTALGSSVSAHSALANLIWNFSQRADLSARVFVLGATRDESSSLNGINGDPASPDFGQFIGPGAANVGQVLRAYQMRGRMPLGSGELVAQASLSNNSFSMNGGYGTTPYDVDHHDQRYNGALSWQRTFDRSQFTIGGYTRLEQMTVFTPPTIATDPVNPGLWQGINVVFARGGIQASPKLRLDAGVFASHYTTFGSNFDGRFGAIYSASPATSFRFSVGTGFRAPLLIERYVFPATQLVQDANGVFTGQGNASEQPERATEYELGFSHQYSPNSTLDFSLYRTKLRNPIEVFYPLSATAPAPGPDCTNPANTPLTPFAGCFSGVSNTGFAVYEGGEVRFRQNFEAQHLFLTASYGLNVAYPRNFDSQYSNPTSGGNLVNGAQFLGIPQQQGSMQLDWAQNGWHSSTVAIFRGTNNELHQPPFTIFNALVGKQIGKNLDLSLAGTNLFNSGAGRYTVFAGGVPYRGVVGQDASNRPIYGNLPTDARDIEPLGVRLILTFKQ